MDYDSLYHIYNFIECVNDKLNFLAVCKLWSLMPRNFKYYLDRNITDFTNVKRLYSKGLPVPSEIALQLEELISTDECVVSDSVPNLKRLSASEFQINKVHHNLKTLRVESISLSSFNLLPNIRSLEIEDLITCEVDFRLFPHLEELKINTMSGFSVGNLKKLILGGSLFNLQYYESIDHLIIPTFIKREMDNVKKLTYIGFLKPDFKYLKKIPHVCFPFLEGIKLPFNFGQIKIIELYKKKIYTKMEERICRVCSKPFHIANYLDYDYCCDPSDNKNKYIFVEDHFELYKVKNKNNRWIKNQF